MDNYMPRHRGWLIPSLGLTQIVAWGAMFYAYGVLMQSMQDELGLSKPAIVGAYSVALLISGLPSTSAGSIIDRIGGRLLMGGGALLAALMLACLSRVQDAVGLYLADPRWSDEQLIDFMLQHPILINRPIVVTPLGTRLCRPWETVLDILPRPQHGAFNKEDGEPVVDLEGRRV